MKTTLKLVFTVVFVALSNTVSAQTTRFAHIDMNELIMSMPEADSAMVALQRFGEGLEKEIDETTVEISRKIDDFQRNQESMAEIVRQSRIEEIQRMQSALEQFQQRAQEAYQQEYIRLLQPIQEKAQRAIDAVREEQGITYVFNSQMIHSMSRDAIDLMPAVRQHLGIR